MILNLENHCIIQLPAWHRSWHLHVIQTTLWQHTDYSIETLWTHSWRISAHSAKCECILICHHFVYSMVFNWEEFTARIAVLLYLLNILAPSRRIPARAGAIRA